MKILAISTWFPFPPDNGSKARAYNLLHHLGTRHTLDLLALSQSKRDSEYLREVQAFCRRVTVFPEPQFRLEKIGSWRGFLSPVPRYFREHHCPELEALSQQWAYQECYEAVVAVTLGSAPYAAKLSSPFKLLDQHNVESQVIKRQWRNEESAFRRLRIMPTWMKAERFERAIAAKFHTITVVSEPERYLMERLLKTGLGTEVHVIPNGADPGLLDYQPPAKEPAVLAFTGALSYQPNLDAAECLCRHILPAVRARFPNARVRITGRIEGVDVRDLSGIAGVEFTGYVEDIRPVVASASALVVPLRQGGGTRVKILEAMALGTPVISTPMGAEGLEVQDGTHVLLGETAADLAEQASRVIGDVDFGNWIAANAKEIVRDRYQWPVIAREFEGVIARNVERRCAQRGTPQRLRGGH